MDKAGSWYSFEGSRIGQGRENVKKYLAENPEALNRIEALLMESLKQEKQDKDKKAEKQGEGAESAGVKSEDAADAVEGTEESSLQEDFIQEIDPDTGEILL